MTNNMNISIWTAHLLIYLCDLLIIPKNIFILFPTWLLFSHTFQLVLRRPAGPAGSFTYQLTRNAMCENIQPVGWSSWSNNRWRRLGVEICWAGQKTQMCFFLSLLCNFTLLHSNKVNVSVSVYGRIHTFLFLLLFSLHFFVSFLSCFLVCFSLMPFRLQPSSHMCLLKAWW